VTSSELPGELATALGNAVELQSPPLLEELRLWLIAGHVDLDARCEELMRGSYAPYWAVCWGAGQALARHVLDHPALVRGKVVVDFGAGSGVVALAAARAGAARAIAVDNDPLSCRIAAANAASNQLAIEVSPTLPARYDVLLAADVLYDAEATRLVLDAAACAEVLVSDPHRHGAARLPDPPVATLAAAAFPDVDYPICTAFIHRVRARERAGGAGVPN
jgi:predicted nicotinamide N-methyase